MGSMDWNHLIGTTIGGFVVGFSLFLLHRESHKAKNRIKEKGAVV